MATKKLSEALAELQKAASVSGLDVRLVVAGQSSTDNAQTITLQQLLTALNVPTPQTNTNGNSGQYIYSNDADATKDVLCGVFKVFQNGTELKLCHKIWGSGNNKYDDGKYHTVDFPHVSTSSAGVFEAPMLVRLRNTTLKEVNSTTQAVNITYPNYKDGSTQVLTLSAATTAKAGVMTSEQVQLLNKLANTSTTIDVVSDSKDGLMSAEMYKTLKSDTFQPSFGASDVQINYKGIDNTSKSFVLTGATTEQSGIMTAEQAKQLQNLVNNPTTSAKQYLKWDSANHKFTFVETEAESDAVIPLASSENDGLITKKIYSNLEKLYPKSDFTTGFIRIYIPNYITGFSTAIDLYNATSDRAGIMSASQAKILEEIQSNYKDFGHFDSESDALAKLSDISVCSDNNIVHAHMTYANGGGKTTLILIQSIDGKECRQIIYNKMKIFHRTITFTDTNRTEVSWKEDWQFLFGDRLKWDKGSHKYLLSQFGNNFGSDYTDPIPLAGTNTDGLMSKSQVTDLASLKTKVENIKDEIPVATDSSNGLMSMAQVTDLVSLKKTAKRKKTQIFPPCVHKAIPLMPKKGRCYFNARGELHFNVEHDKINNGKNFKYVENKVGKLICIKRIYFTDDDGYVRFAEKLSSEEKYFTITKDNWKTLFGDAQRVQFTVKVSDAPCCIEILSDEAITFSDDFELYFYDYTTQFKETASPNFKIDNSKVVYTRQLTKGYFSQNNCIAYYCKNCKKKTTINGKKVSVSKRWKKMNWNGSIFKLNHRSLKYRLYPFRKKWKKNYIGNGFIEVLRGKNGGIRKILP